MVSSQDIKHTGRLLAWSSAALVMAGSIGFTAPAFAGQPTTPSTHAAQGQAFQQEHTPASARTSHTSGTGKGHSAPTASHGSAPAADHTGSGVSLDKPNDFQAQSDPDGMLNGGVDQPGGTGGVDTTTQDGNNGSGNDTDCEDDNRGVGVPGHCKDRPAPATSPVDDITLPTSDLVVETGIPGQGGLESALLAQPGASSTVLAPVQGTTTQVSAPAAGSAQVDALRSSSAAGVLPNTGAGQALLGLLIAALAALGLGAGLTRHGRRAARVTA
jgi:hypothetical protein